MKIVIAGGGRVGSALAGRLIAAQHSVTVIERDRDVCEHVFEELGAVTVCGDATDPRSLEAAGVASADVVAAMLARDSDNLAFTMLARARTNARLMVRMLDERYREAYRIAGARDVIAEADVVVAKIETAIEFPNLAGLIPLPAGDMILFELPIATRAIASGRTVAEIKADPMFPRDCVFIAIVDPSGHTELPTGQSVLRPNHTAILVARRAQLASAIDYLAARPTQGGDSAAGLDHAMRQIDFLSPLDERERAELARGMSIERRAEGEEIFLRGEQGDSFYLVLAGEVALLDEHERLLESVQEGGFFGEVAMLTGEPRGTSARATRDCQLAVIDRDDFRRVIMTNPALAFEMSRILGRRLADAARRRTAPPPPITKKKGFFGR